MPKVGGEEWGRTGAVYHSKIALGTPFAAPGAICACPPAGFSLL